jgi:hypothetical protein
MKELAKAVCYWLSYKAATGTSQLLTEGSLSIPIAESLFFYRWEIDTETDYNVIFPSISAHKIFADFYAKRGDERLALETKFFKSSCNNKVFNDFVRLGLADLDSVRRILLLAWSKNAEEKAFREFKRLLSLKKEETLTIDPIQCIFDCEGQPVSLSKNKVEFAQLRGLQNPEATSKVRITCTDVTRSETYGAAEYSIKPA